MSAGGEGNENLNQEGKTPTAPVSEDTPISTTKDEIVSCTLKEVNSNPPVPATKADSLEDARLLEALIEKKLPSDKEKGLDVDSELDFELKWDDDADLNENQGIDDIDLDNAGKELEGHVSIEKDVEKEADSAFTSIEQELDSLGKTDNSFSSMEKDLDSLDKEGDTSMSEDKDLDKETEGILSSIDEHLDAAVEEIKTALEEKDIDNIDSLIDNKSEKKDHKIDAYMNINTMNVENIEECKVKEINNESNIVPKSSSDGVLNTEVTPEKTKTSNIDTNVGIDTELKTSFVSEANSLDEQLVYSPDVEDKDLIDEIDATDISNDNFENNETAISSDYITDKLDEAGAAEKLSPDVITSHKEGETTEKDQTVMDVNVDSVKSQMTQKSVNDTISSTTDMDTSTYDINNEHGLDRPDVMIEIPTQELIDTFDDADDTFDNANDKEDQSVSNIIDKLDLIESKDDTENFTEKKTTEDIINLSKTIPEENPVDKLLTDDIETSNKIADDIAQIESMEVDTDNCFKEPEIDTNDTTKVEEINIPNLDTKKPDEENIMTVEEKVTHADIVLEANSEQQKAQDIPTETVANVENIVLEANSEQKKAQDTTPTETVANVESNEDIVLEANSEQQKVQDTTPTETVANVESNEDIVLEANSEQQKVQDTTATETVANVENIVLEANSEQQKSQDTTPTETVANVESNEDIVLEANSEQQKVQDTTATKTVANVENIVLEANSEQQKLQDTTPTETVANVESNEDIVLEANSEQQKAQETTPKEIVVNLASNQDIVSEANSEQQNTILAEAVANIEGNVESSDNSELKDTPVPKTLDEAQPSTSKYHQESSDEDQEATDSLGLLAESSRVMDDDDEQEQEPEPEDDEDEDDFDQDDESNQMTAEHSEDSNAQQSEAEVPKESMDVDESNEAKPEPNVLADETDIQTDMSEMEESRDGLPETAEALDGLPDETGAQSDDIIEDDQSSDEKDDLDIQIGAVMSQNEVEAVVAPESIETTEETQKAVEALLEDEKTKESEDASPVAARIEEKEVEPGAGSDEGTSKLRELLLKNESPAVTPEEKTSPSKTKKLEISKPKNEINIVELEESSSEDDIQVINKSALASGAPKDVTLVTIPSGVEVMAAAAGETSEIQEKDGEVRVSGLPKPQPHKPTRLNTDEISIKTASAAEPFVVPETTSVPKTAESKAPIDFGLEIFSLDSADEETEVRSKRKSKLTAVELDKARQTNKCINMNCTSDGSVPLVPASLSAAVYYAANQQRGGGLCLHCAKRFEERSDKLVEGVKDLTPYLYMDMCMIREELVEISDSDSEDEPDIVKDDDEIIGEKGAKFLEEQLAAMFNDTWKKFNMEERLLSAQTEINVEVSQLEEECKEIDALLNECQKETDKLRNDLYATFADDRTELPSIAIVDTPTTQWSGLEEAVETPPPTPEVKERPKRRSASAVEPPAKRAAIPLGYEPIDRDASTSKQVEPSPAPIADLSAQNDDDNADISVVKLSVEAAPLGLPPPGVATRAPLRPNTWVYAMRNTFGAWHKVRIQEVQPKAAGQFTMCRVRFEQPKTITKLLPARCLAYEQPPDVRLTIGTRVVALFKDHRVEKKEEGEKKEAYYSGIVAEIPNPVNSFRYLIFFDDGYAQYVQHANTRLVCECAPRVWDEVHPFSRNFVRDYLRAYPERPMVRLHAGQSIKTEWDGKWWVSKVLQVDASLVLVYFDGKKDNKTEWIYRGSTRLAPLYLELQAAERTRARPLPRAQAARRFNMPYVEYTRSDETEKSATTAPAATPAQSPAQIQASMEQEIRRQRAVAKKSTALPPVAAAPAPAVARDNVTSRVVFYTPKNAIKPHKMAPHTCGPRCRRTDVLALKDLRTYNPLTKPLLSGWERQTVRYRIPAVKAVMYRAPCGRRIRNYEELHKYLQAIDSDMGVDLFDFNPATHCLAEFLLNKCLISKKDLSHGKENVPVPCVNYYDSSLPEFCSYNTERTPTAGVPLNLDPEFLCGCDCTDDCADKSKCACWKMTLEGARTIGLDTREVGYVYKRLPEPLPSGIYECNSRCKCKQTCLNRVAQHPLQLKLQVFKTANRGWGIRALNDVPKGAFLCVYAGNLLTDATANLDGLNEGDEYLAELDYIEVVEQMKEGFEEDIPEDAKKLDEEENDSSSMSSSSEEEPENPNADDDFRPTLPTGQYAPSEYSKRLRKREKSKAKEKEDREKKQREKDGDDCITISDDEELREPAHFSAQAGMGGKEFVSKYKSVRTLFGKDEACYIMDAKVQGNIGRYLNHSCTPNVFVQNVFVDTHDPRFPWVAFFALSQVRAGTELTWNYNYDVGSVPGKVLYCYCNAPNCRGRLL